VGREASLHRPRSLSHRAASKAMKEAASLTTPNEFPGRHQVLWALVSAYFGLSVDSFTTGKKRLPAWWAKAVDIINLHFPTFYVPLVAITDRPTPCTSPCKGPLP
jgi:hypothetical protein